MVGLYDISLGLLGSGPPEYEFVLRLPGKLIETNGTIMTGDHTRWTFTGGEMFPRWLRDEGADYRHRYRRSNKSSRSRGDRIRGEGALEFIKLVGEEGPLLNAVRKAHQAGNSSALAPCKHAPSTNLCDSRGWGDCSSNHSSNSLQRLHKPERSSLD